jgi:hypothetical protein
LLLESEIVNYAGINFSKEIELDDLVFYSKRLNLYVDKKNERLFVKYL